MSRVVPGLILGLLLVAGLGCASGGVHESVDTGAAAEVPRPSVSNGSEGFGIGDAKLRRTNHGYLIDFRFRVVDEALASVLLDRNLPIRLVDPSTGGTYQVIGSPKIGPLRNTGTPVEGRIYYVLFANPGAALVSGASLEIEIGDWRLEGLVLE